MEPTYSGVALEGNDPPQADVKLQEAQRSHPGLEPQKEPSPSPAH